MNKTELLESMRRGRHDWEALIASIPEERLEEPGVEGAWSVKDLMAHLAAWQAHLAGRIEAGLAAPSAAPGPRLDVDALNREFWASNRERTLAEVRAAARDSADRLEALVRELEPDAITDSRRFAWTREQPLWRFVDGDCEEHYAEHGAAVRRWLGATVA